MGRIKPTYGKSIEISIKNFNKNDKKVVLKLENTSFSWATILTALWYNNLEELFNDFFVQEVISPDYSLDQDKFLEKYTENYLLTFNQLRSNSEDDESQPIEIKAINKKKLLDIYTNKPNTLTVYIIPKKESLLLNDINIKMFNKETCVNYMYSKIRKSVILGQAQNYVDKTFFNTDFYSLGEIGRYVFNRKFGTNSKSFVLEKDDIRNTIKYLINFFANEKNYFADDLYCLSNLYVKTIEQYLANDIRSSTLNLKRTIIEKIKIIGRKENIEDINKDINGNSLINLGKINISSKILKFFLLHPSSQFLFQVNPLSSLMHRSKINTMDDSTSASSDHSSFESRNIQKTFYSRMCCITTPDNKMVGLVNFATLYCKLDDHGFICAPYNKVENGKELDEIIYLSAFEEINGSYYISDFSSKKNGEIQGELVRCRNKGEVIMTYKKNINLVDRFRNQTVSISSSLIPFLEHNDNTRASMGSNMMRQILPMNISERPMVGTGLEGDVLEKTKNITFAKDDGYIIYADSIKIIIEYNNLNITETYKLFNCVKTNQNTLFFTESNVITGQEIKKGDRLTNSSCSQDGKLSLGKNLLTVVLPYEGLNFEDAIAISDSCIKNKTFDSYFINEVVVAPEKTKLGFEKITKDILFLNPDHQLDDNGIIKVGSIVKEGDVLVGKITPETREFQNKVDEKIMNIVFGDNLKYKNTSVKFHGDLGQILEIIYIQSKKLSNLQNRKIKTIKIIIGERTGVKVGDKICGRYGNKNIIAKIIPECDMPYLEDGRIAEAIVNPLGIVSRMNIGQLLEMNLTLAMKKLDIPYIDIKPYDKNNITFIEEMLIKAGYPKSGKIDIIDGKTNIKYKQPVTTGYMYTLPMEHKVDHKFNARSINTYSVITQQPLAGRSNNGGQRTGQMELWGLEAFGAKSTILEKTSVLSDDMENKKKLIKNIIFGGYRFKFGRTSTFNFFNQLLTSLCFKADLELDIQKTKEITENDDDDKNK